MGIITLLELIFANKILVRNRSESLCRRMQGKTAHRKSTETLQERRLTSMAGIYMPSAAHSVLEGTGTLIPAGVATLLHRKEV